METLEYPNIAFVRAICAKEQLQQKVNEFNNLNIHLNYKVEQKTEFNKTLDELFEFEDFSELSDRKENQSNVVLSYIITKEQRAQISNGTKNEIKPLPDNLFYSLKYDESEKIYALTEKNKGIVEKAINLIACARDLYEKLPSSERCNKCNPDYAIEYVGENQAKLRFSGPRSFVSFMEQVYLKESFN